MENRYQDRTVGQVEIYGLGPIVVEGSGGASSEGIFGHVLFRLTSPDGGFGGPQASIEIAFEHSPDRSVRDAQQQALAAAHALLVRLAAEPLESLQAKLDEGIKAALLPGKD